MRQAIIFLFLSLLLLENSSRLGVMIWFTVNQTGIAKTRCENRFNPKAHCNGHCVLAKRMKAIDQRQNQSAPQTLQPEIQWFTSTFLSSYSFNPAYCLLNTRVGFSADPVHYPVPAYPVFHPPNS